MLLLHLLMVPRAAGRITSTSATTHSSAWTALSRVLRYCCRAAAGALTVLPCCQREERIQRFCRDDNRFVFLLSTRAGMLP